MMNWWKERKKAKAMAEAHRIGMNVVEAANIAMDEWEAVSLQVRRQAMAHSFDERLVQIGELGDLTFDELTEIESLALLKNWIDQKSKIVSEISHFIDSETWESLKIIGVAEIYMERLAERFDAVGRDLAEDIMLASEEEADRRSRLHQ